MLALILKSKILFILSLPAGRQASAAHFEILRRTIQGLPGLLILRLASQD
jgi:hypothetical protein